MIKVVTFGIASKSCDSPALQGINLLRCNAIPVEAFMLQGAALTHKSDCCEQSVASKCCRRTTRSTSRSTVHTFDGLANERLCG